ncbi:Protein kinase superfamily protein [Striga hermonthica]|uniref:Protein kinase superfamily protein n=1 Tax=Striga hermonthica TaxID=68872 RepID=A0A9N7NIT8_STRHE|nr:Protein kinase superfamily protein [Striga hermonthica]
MRHKNHKLVFAIGLSSLSFLTILLFTIFSCRKRKQKELEWNDLESNTKRDSSANSKDFIKFEGCAGLSLHEILDAPGEVIGKSSYGTLYRASLLDSNSLAVLRFLRPSCALGTKEVLPIVNMFGCMKHPNLVPLNAFYAGPRGEKLMVHPFYECGNLSQFIRVGNGKAREWPVIHKISIGITLAIQHLHSSLGKPLPHGNLKSNNVLLDRHYRPYVSDFGLHLLLSPTAAQQMLEASASQGYTAPELLKMRDVCMETDMYALGVIFLELLIGKLAADENSGQARDFELRSVILKRRITDWYRWDMLVGLSGDERAVVEDQVLKYFQLAIACCSPSRLVRPDIGRVLEKLQELGR